MLTHFRKRLSVISLKFCYYLYRGPLWKFSFSSTSNSAEDSWVKNQFLDLNYCTINTSSSLEDSWRGYSVQCSWRANNAQCRSPCQQVRESGESKPVMVFCQVFNRFLTCSSWRQYLGIALGLFKMVDGAEQSLNSWFLLWNCKDAWLS